MRSVTRKLAMTSAIAAVSLGVVAASMGTASADPTVTPNSTDIVSVGSDTIQALDNGISSDRTGGYPGLADGTGKYYSWDATGSSSITPKSGAGSIARPNGSGAGITELNATTNSTVDIARSSRGPNTGSTDWFIPFGVDGVGWSSKTPTSTSPADTNGPKTLTSAELTGIYNCTYTTWASLPTDHTASTDTIKVYLPQASSGTRAFFLKALGITATTEPCWESYGPEENEGTDAVFNDPDVIYPYSLSHYVGQAYKGKGGGSDLPGYLSPVRTLDTVAQINTTTQDWNAVSSTYTRSVYHVVRQSDWSDATEGPRLKGLLGRNNGTTGGWLCGSTGQAAVTSFGFHLLGSGCGTPQAGI